MTSLLDRLFSREPKSAQVAKDRLKLVLIHDRTAITAQSLDKLKDDMIRVVSQHVEIDRDAVRVEVHKDGRRQRLIADIPLQTKRIRR